MIFVCDASTLIALARIGKFDLLRQVLGKIYIPEAVFEEVVVKGKEKPGSKETTEAKYIERVAVKDRLAVDLLLSSHGLGEAEAIVLAKEMKADILYLDERKASATAQISGIEVRGTLDIIITAYKMGLLKDIKSVLDELKNKKFWLDNETYDEVIKKLEFHS